MIWYLYDRIGYDIIFSSRVSSQRGSYLKRSISTCIFNHFYTSLANLQQIIHLMSEEHMWSSKGHSRHCTTPTFSKLWSSHLQVECRLWGMPCGNRRCVETVSFDLDAASSAACGDWAEGIRYRNGALYRLESLFLEKLQLEPQCHTGPHSKSMQIQESCRVSSLIRFMDIER